MAQKPQTPPAETEDNAKSQAGSQYESIRDMLDVYDKAETEQERDEAESRMMENALSVEVRSMWHTPGGDNTAAEYTILLFTGGPAVRIIGELNRYAQADTARIEYQDWGTPWTELYLTQEETQTLLAYAQRFYFEE